MEAIRWKNGALYLLDQTRLPTAECWLRYTEYRPVSQAIRSMVVRGAGYRRLRDGAGRHPRGPPPGRATTKKEVQTKCKNYTIRQGPRSPPDPGRL